MGVSWDPSLDEADLPRATLGSSSSSSKVIGAENGTWIIPSIPSSNSQKPAGDVSEGLSAGKQSPSVRDESGGQGSESATLDPGQREGPSKVGAEAMHVERLSTVSSPILYKLEWTDEDGKKQRPFLSNEPFDKLELAADVDRTLTAAVGNDGKVEVVLEVISRVYGSRKWRSEETLEQLKTELAATSRRSMSDSLGTNPDQVDLEVTPPSIQLDDIAIHHIGRMKLIIHSSTLLETLRSLVNYYPSQNLTGDGVEIYEPFSVIVHHLAELESFVDDSRIDANIGLPSQKAVHDVKLLVGFIQSYIQKSVRPIEERLSRPQPVIKYEDLWYLFKPGDDVYLKNLDKLIAAVVMKTEYKGVVNPVIVTSGDNCEVSYWVLSTDGVDIGREDDIEIIPAYKGEREVTSLPVFPCRFWETRPDQKRRERFEERGRLFFDLLRAGNKQMQYDGKTFPFRNKTYRGPIIVDVSAALRYDRLDMDDKDYSVSLGVEDNISGAGLFESRTGPEQIERAFKWATYEAINIKSTETLTPHHYFLLGPFVPGFALKEKRWKLFDIENISELPEIDMTYQNLVIDHKDQEIIRAISHPQVSDWKLDFIQGKGEGQIVLLHGPPGVGKTYTVECISEATSRPLISLTIADIGLDEKRVETELIKWFTLAEGWEAILLIDEADIFLERRKGADIARNSLVSVFLRKMEYFRGLLFLTTNRIGQIDDAFLSRVHVVIGYSPLDDDKRKRIWHGFFRKLERDMEKHSDDGTRTESKIELSKYAREYVLEDKEVLDLKWNGREIRNAFQTAISLAGYQSVKESVDKTRPPRVVDVRKEHFVSVVQMSRAFHTYMDSIINKGEAQRARARMERNDDY